MITDKQFEQLKFISKHSAGGCHPKMAEVLLRHGFIEPYLDIFGRHNPNHIYKVTDMGRKYLRDNTKMEDKISEIERISNELVEKQKNLAKDIETQIGIEIAKMIKLDDNIHSVFWYQYTPAFNDGEPCEFSVNGFYYILENDIEEMCKEDGYYDLEAAVGDLMSAEGSSILKPHDFDDAEKYCDQLEKLANDITNGDINDQAFLKKLSDDLRNAPSAYWLKDHKWTNDIIKTERVGDWRERNYNYVLLFTAEELLKLTRKCRKEIALTKIKYKEDGYTQTSEFIGKIVKTLNAIPEEVLEMAFGNGSKILITEKGLTIEEYDCGY